MTDAEILCPKRVNPLISQAQTLLLYSGMLANSSAPQSTRQLQATLIDAVEQFSEAVAATDPEHLDAARYAICALLDETIASSTWGGQAWPQYSLLKKYYEHDYRGEAFFSYLERTGKEREDGVQLLEFFHQCLSLGYSGRFHQRRYTDSKIRHMRSQVAELIEQYRSTAPASLSPPLDPPRPDRRIPLWIIGSLIGAPLLGAYQGMSWHLSQIGDPLLKTIQEMARTSGQ